MFSTSLTKILAVAIPFVLALGNLVPSNMFLSIAVVAAFFSYYVSTCGTTAIHDSLQRTAIASASCVVALAPVVIFDNFFFFDDPTKSFMAGALKAVGEFTPYYVFFLSIGYALWIAVSAALTYFNDQQVKK